THPIWGEAVEAEVVLSDQRLDAAQLRGQLRKRIASYKLPQALHFVRSIETTLIGKVKN
ncbi:MAG: long-chain fatty acid--CoA ligase, partial [Bdellovibrionales bacterium]|nr:long-chain fatty acid--CoA ligase [Bdellovibrionales bacterium]